jgi:hypothetical protein
MRRNIHIIMGLIIAVLTVAGGPTIFGQTAGKTQNVTVVNSDAAPVPVKVIKESKKRFQFTVGTDILAGGSGRTILFPLPVGKRLVIEHVSARTYRPAGIRMNIEFGTYYDNGDLFGPEQGLAFHGIALIEQGAELSGNEVSAASHDVLVFAEDRLGTTTDLPLRVRFSLSDTVPFGKFARGTVVFTGYVEDNPAP